LAVSFEEDKPFSVCDGSRHQTRVKTFFSYLVHRILFPSRRPLPTTSLPLEFSVNYLINEKRADFIWFCFEDDDDDDDDDENDDDDDDDENDDEDDEDDEDDDDEADDNDDVENDDDDDEDDDENDDEDDDEDDEDDEDDADDHEDDDEDGRGFVRHLGVTPAKDLANKSKDSKPFRQALTCVWKACQAYNAGQLGVL